MGIEFKKCEIESFYSIGKTQFDIRHGVYFVKGRNYDISPDGSVSNGSGKTALFNAIFQCLFNKNKKDPKSTLASVNNIFYKGGRPYKISVEFSKDGSVYKIINDRSLNRIFIEKDGVDVSPKSITKQLQLIREIIGLDFKIFSSLVYLNLDSLMSIMDITSSESMVYQFFRLDKINELEKKLKLERRDIRSDILTLETEIANYKHTLQTLDEMKHKTDVDIETLKLSIEVLQNELQDLTLKKIEKEKEIVQKKTAVVQEELSKVTAQRAQLEAELQTCVRNFEFFKKGICPTCGAPVDSKVKTLEIKIDTLRRKASEAAAEERAVQNKIKSFDEQLQKLNDAFRKKEAQLVEKINIMKVKVMTAEQLEEELQRQAKNRLEIERQLEETQIKVNKLKKKEEFLSGVLELIGSGELLYTLLEDYIKIVNYYLTYYTSLSSFDFEIFAGLDPDSKSLKYTFYEKIGSRKSVKKSFSQLSSGERTRVSLAILVATLKTLEHISGVSINLVVFDEILGVLDKDGVEYLKKIVNDMRADKAVYIISHHDEIDEDFIDGTIEITKKNGISEVHYEYKV